MYSIPSDATLTHPSPLTQLSNYRSHEETHHRCMRYSVQNSIEYPVYVMIHTLHQYNSGRKEHELMSCDTVFLQWIDNGVHVYVHYTRTQKCNQHHNKG